MSPRLSELFLSSQSDERLVALARAGHERAFAAIVERYRPELHALARRLCADGRGEDLVQQAFLSAFTALRSGAEVAHLRGWLYRILRNAAYRSRAPQCVPLDHATASVETLEDVVQQRALAMSVLTELARLPERQRQAMVETVGGMARSEVASTMGLSEGAVRQLVHRARSTLRTAVTAVTPWPLIQWIASGPSSGGSPAEMVAGAAAGAASTGGFLGVKLGIVVASGVIATGVAAVDIHGSRHGGASRPTARVGALAGHPQPAQHGVHAVKVVVASAGVSPAVVTPSVVSRAVLRPAVAGSTAVVYVGTSSRSRNASHGVSVRRPKVLEPTDGGGTDRGRHHTGAVGGGGTYTSVTVGGVPGRNDGSGTSGGGGTGRQDGGGDQTAGRSDNSGNESRRGGVDGNSAAAPGARSSSGDAGGGGEGGGRGDGVGGTGGSGGSDGGADSSGGGGSTDGGSGQLVSGLTTDAAGSGSKPSGN